MTTEPRPAARRVLIVGAGLAGLSCARDLAAHGHEAVILEASDRVGGRVTSDVVDGFTLDRGFQVHLTAYREAAQLFDESALNFRRFFAGARLWDGRRFVTVADPVRHPLIACTALFRGVTTLKELRSLTAIALALGRAVDESASTDGRTSEQWLLEQGISPGFIDRFFRPFFGGVFLDRSMQTDSGRMRYYASCFARGSAVVPARGMRAISEAIASKLPAGCVRLGSAVDVVARNSVRLRDGSCVEGDAVVVATDSTVACELLPGLPPLPWQSTMTAWFATPDPNFAGRALYLSSAGSGLVHHACSMSAIAPEYAPPGRGLFCANHVGGFNSISRGVTSEREIASEMKRELDGWFGSGATASWELIRLDRIARAVPRQHPGDAIPPRPLEIGGVHLAGDHCTDASINGALRSGRLAAARAVASCR